MTSAARSSTPPDPLATRIPVTVITGFLGSGKTTLLRHLLHQPHMNRAAVIINEFGEVGIDHELVEASSEQLMLLSNGCLCCSVRTDLQETLRDLFVKRRSGEVIDFDRVFVETTGLADPAPVLHSLQSDGLLGAAYRLNGVVTLVDAVNGLLSLDTMVEASKQAAIADRLVITKTDIAEPQLVEQLTERLRAMNRYATLFFALNGVLDAEVLRDITPTNLEALAREPDGWLTGGRGAPTSADGEGHLQDLTRLSRGASGTHDASISSFCLWFGQPFTWDSLSEALNVLKALRGPDLLRVKGIVNVKGEEGPVAIHGVQHVFHPPLKLPRWSNEERRSRIVFIVRNIPRPSIEGLFSAVGKLGASASE